MMEKHFGLAYHAGYEVARKHARKNLGDGEGGSSAGSNVKKEKIQLIGCSIVNLAKYENGLSWTLHGPNYEIPLHFSSWIDLNGSQELKYR